MKKKLFREQYQEPIDRIEPEIVGELEVEEKVEEKKPRRRRIKK